MLSKINIDISIQMMGKKDDTQQNDFKFWEFKCKFQE